MPTQYPTLNGGEQTARWENMAKQNLFPYSYLFTAAWTNATDFGNTFPKSVSIGNSQTLSYFTMEFKSDNNMAISILEYSAALRFFNAAGAGFSVFMTEVSYNVNMAPNVISNVSTPPSVPTTPSDIGNVIYRHIESQAIPTTSAGSDTNQSVKDFHRYEPYNYLMKFRQSIYMHVGFLSTLGANNAGQMWGAFTFHNLCTGLQS